MGETFRSPPFRRTTFFCPAAKEGKNAPLIFGSTRSLFPTSHLIKTNFSAPKVASFFGSATFEAPKAVVAKFSPQRQLSFSVISSATNLYSSIVRFRGYGVEFTTLVSLWRHGSERKNPISHLPKCER